MSTNIRNNARNQCPLILNVRFGSIVTQALILSMIHQNCLKKHWKLGVFILVKVGLKVIIVCLEKTQSETLT